MKREFKFNLAELHKKKWLWRADNPEKNRADWPGWRVIGWVPMSSFACEAAVNADNDSDNDCVKCPLVWPDGRQCRSRLNIKNRWAVASENLSESSELARQIADLTWTGRQIFPLTADFSGYFDSPLLTGLAECIDLSCLDELEFYIYNEEPGLAQSIYNLWAAEGDPEKKAALASRVEKFPSRIRAECEKFVGRKTIFYGNFALLHKKMWAWLADNPDKKKADWPGWRAIIFTDIYSQYDNFCFACAAVRDDCKKCPLVWPDGRSCNNYGHSIYDLWRDEYEEDDAMRARLARQIADLTWTGRQIFPLGFNTYSANLICKTELAGCVKSHAEKED